MTIATRPPTVTVKVGACGVATDGGADGRVADASLPRGSYIVTRSRPCPSITSPSSGSNPLSPLFLLY